MQRVVARSAPTTVVLWAQGLGGGCMHLGVQGVAQGRQMTVLFNADHMLFAVAERREQCADFAVGLLPLRREAIGIRYIKCTAATGNPSFQGAIGDGCGAARTTTELRHQQRNIGQQRGAGQDRVTIDAADPESAEDEDENDGDEGPRSNELLTRCCLHDPCLRCAYECLYIPGADRIAVHNYPVPELTHPGDEGLYVRIPIDHTDLSAAPVIATMGMLVRQQSYERDGREKTSTVCCDYTCTYGKVTGYLVERGADGELGEWKNRSACFFHRSEAPQRMCNGGVAGLRPGHSRRPQRPGREAAGALSHDEQRRYATDLSVTKSAAAEACTVPKVPVSQTTWPV